MSASATITPPPVPKRRRRSRKAYHILVSCCLFFAILCGCLITALVFIGKHYYHNATVLSGGKLEIDQAVPERLLSRLSGNVIPTAYDITLKPNLTDGGYVGRVEISIETAGDASSVSLHAKNLTIGAVTLSNSSGDAIELKLVREDAFEERLEIETAETIPADNYTLSIEFAGSLLNKTKGFYISKYRNEDGVKRSMATSKFEPTYARQAFPCFDEPNMKAKFTVHLLKPKDPQYIALSNMPQSGEKETDEGILVSFQESVPMSTYLAAFIVSDFKALEDVITTPKYGSFPLRVFATPAQLNKTEYALRTGKKIMEFYLKYFDIAYPLPKLDMVAIPDFVSGAMEHWGLVTYRETALLYDPEVSSAGNQQRVATVIAHELAHSWFGNLVTMDWWNELWLNEGFASYIEYKGVNYAEPSWKIMEQFITEDMHKVMKLDSTLGSHPIVTKVETPDQITAIFDSISYSKGASVLRMLEQAVGEEVFRNAVTSYLNKHKYGNAVTQHLLDEIQTLVREDINVTEFIGTWTVQMGLPVVEARKIKGGYRLTQKRFLEDPEKESQDHSETIYKYRWTIPVTYITSAGNETKMKWFKHSEEFIDVLSEDAWLKFNPNQVGYYRVNYEMEQWRQLASVIGELSSMDRAHLVAESFAIASSGMLTYDVPLDLTKYLTGELDFVPWQVASSELSNLEVYMLNSASLGDYKKYVLKTVTPAVSNLTWNESSSDSLLQRLTRVKVLSLACKMGHPESLAEATTKFGKWLNDEEKLSQDLKAIIYNYGMKSASKADWEKMWDRFVAENDAGEKLRLLSGLASVNDITLLRKLVYLAEDETYIRSQDYFTLLGDVSANPAGTSFVWEYVRENWEKLVIRFGLNERYLGRLIPTITKTFSTVTKREEMEAFFKKYPDAGAGAGARVQALETVNNNIKWVSTNLAGVEEWISKNKDFS